MWDSSWENVSALQVQEFNLNSVHVFGFQLRRTESSRKGLLMPHRAKPHSH
jgi:hypothetical protein